MLKANLSVESTDCRAAFYERVLGEVAGIPGVRAAGLSASTTTYYLLKKSSRMNTSAACASRKIRAPIEQTLLVLERHDED